MSIKLLAYLHYNSCWNPSKAKNALFQRFFKLLKDSFAHPVYFWKCELKQRASEVSMWPNLQTDAEKFRSLSSWQRHHKVHFYQKIFIGYLEMEDNFNYGKTYASREVWLRWLAVQSGWESPTWSTCPWDRPDVSIYLVVVTVIQLPNI